MKEQDKSERVWVAFQGVAYSEAMGVGMLRIEPEREVGDVIEVTLELLTAFGWVQLWRDTVPNVKLPVTEPLAYDESAPMSTLQTVRFERTLVSRAVAQAAFLYGSSLRMPTITAASAGDHDCLREARSQIRLS